MLRRSVPALLLAFAAFASAGVAADMKKPVDVKITLGEYTVESSLTSFEKGVPYHFIIENAGQREHEWMIIPRSERDTKKALIEVEEDDLKPGATAVRDFTFKEAGEFEFACHVGRHYSKGMVLAITVK
ncbi:cupredoxin domain-containing protein [Gloeobacter kilaueensis]|uniref:Inactive ferrous ion transporter periplasmic protein EfeO n=1 Tax=Gloeobacter kilaueensis (strain ATCC BAA-2537 / CCAP 1431/1 / ULC 316 / JS1) TaxID=1183438 RepID=U5QKU1_GLOK1|nr:cupredoxin domain-containing protein [Gloeobacter kilaueensis]AGY59483.1 inactive ferrous ion transporter periplasmic protein EfeO [Gloeobacter kilaueensis JS1]